MVTTLHVFYALLRKKWRIEYPKLFDHIVNILIWVGCTVFVGGYLLQAQGISKSFGAFQLAGTAATVGLFNIWGYVSDTLHDIEGSNVFGYHLLLPCPAWFVCMSDVILFAARAIIQTVAIILFGKVLLWNQLIMSNISLIPLILLTVIANLFFGAFALWLMSIVKRASQTEQIWIRFIFPLWFLGGFQFTFAAAMQLSPIFGYTMLINPAAYFMEGMRGALLAIPSINPWICMGALAATGLLMFWDATRRLRIFLDFVS